MNGYYTIKIPETTYKCCNNCDNLRYNHDFSIILPKHECTLDDNLELKELYGNVETPSKCPILLKELDERLDKAVKWNLPVFTKKQEYVRSIELFEEIYKEKGLYFAIALLYDSSYTNKDLGEMLKLIKSNKK